MTAPDEPRCVVCAQEPRCVVCGQMDSDADPVHGHIHPPDHAFILPKNPPHICVAPSRTEGT
jgi:hypothetical protein